MLSLRLLSRQVAIPPLATTHPVDDAWITYHPSIATIVIIVIVVAAMDSSSRPAGESTVYVSGTRASTPKNRGVGGAIRVAPLMRTGTMNCVRSGLHQAICTAAWCQNQECCRKLWWGLYFNGVAGSEFREYHDAPRPFRIDCPSSKPWNHWHPLEHCNNSRCHPQRNSV